MLKNIVSVIAGIIVGWFLFTGFQLINYFVVPKPEGFVMGDPGSIKEMIDTMPFYGWALLTLGYVVGSFAAGWVIGKISESKTIILPIGAAILFMMGWLGNIMTIPHPLWIVILMFLIYIPSVLAGHKMGVGKS